MVKFLFKNRVSCLGTFFIISSISLTFYNTYKFRHLNIISQIVQDVYIEKEKQEGEFKYGRTNLNVLYLYIESKSNKRFYIYENVGNDNYSQYLSSIETQIPIGTKIKIWADNDEVKNYNDIEIQKLEIGNVIVYNSQDYKYIILAIIVGVVLLLISRKYA